MAIHWHHHLERQMCVGRHIHDQGYSIDGLYVHIRAGQRLPYGRTIVKFLRHLFGNGRFVGLKNVMRFAFHYGIGKHVEEIVAGRQSHHLKGFVAFHIPNCVRIQVGIV